MRIALSYNLRRDDGPASEPDEPPQPGNKSSVDSDTYAEWDDAQTIEAVESALASRHHRVTLIEANQDAFGKFLRLKPDLVFNIAEGLHGASRESQIPAMLDMLQIPYTGSDPLTLGLCLDKQRTKEILVHHGIPTAKFRTVTSVAEIPDDLAFPLMVKPTLEGSSKGVTDSSLVHDRNELRRQVERVVHSYRQPALVEEFLPGREFTVAMIGNGAGLRVLPIVELNFAALPADVSPIYSYEAKWVWDREEDPLQIFTCPALLEPFLKHRIEEICRRAFQVMGCRDWCRIDVRLDAQGHPNIIELNPLPGVLPRPEQNSCFPKAARAAGMSYEEMILAVVDAACDRLNEGKRDEHRHLL